MSRVAAGTVGLAVALDLAVGEFPERIHPVALFGSLVAPFDRSWDRPRLVGAAVAVGLPLLASGVAAGVVWLATSLSTFAGGLAAALVLFGTTSLRMLLSAARTVVEATESDVGRAREAVRALVGRDAGDLSAAELRSAAVESAAENLADGLVAPLLAFVVAARLGAVVSPAATVSLAAATGAAAWVKAVNTLDSMLGYESKPVGWASARLDDAVMWVPARLSAVLIALAARDPFALRSAAAWAGEPSSPNSGWPMATLAAALDVRLAKPDSYALNSEAALPTTPEARRGVRVVGLAGGLAVAGAGAGSLVDGSTALEVVSWF